MSWVITDGVTSYTFAISPNDMKIPIVQRDTKYNWNPPAGFSGSSSRTTPLPWSFSGVLRTEAQYNALRTWCQSKKKVTITDHLGRDFTARLLSFQPEQSGSSRRSAPWRHVYTVEAALYGLVT